MITDLVSCNNPDLFTMEAIALERAIAEDKWYLSEKAGKDVGWQVAEKHFITNFSRGFAAGFRASYCSLACPHRSSCPYAKKWDGVASPPVKIASS